MISSWYEEKKIIKQRCIKTTEQQLLWPYWNRDHPELIKFPIFLSVSSPSKTCAHIRLPYSGRIRVEIKWCLLSGCHESTRKRQSGSLWKTGGKVPEPKLVLNTIFLRLKCGWYFVLLIPHWSLTLAATKRWAASEMVSFNAGTNRL